MEITGRRVVVSGYLKALITKKLARVARHLSDAGLSASVVVWREKLERVVEITIHARGERFLHAVGAGGTWQSASTTAVEKLDHQASTLKGKWKGRRRR
jgi:ribosomal subunit interface protein